MSWSPWLLSPLGICLTRFRGWQKAQGTSEERVMIDATIVRVHQHGSAQKGGRASKRSDDPVVD